MDLIVLIRIVLVLMETIMCLLVCDGLYWWDVKFYWKNAQNTTGNVMVFGNCIGFNGNYNGVYWYVMDSIGGVLNSIGQMPKTQQK